jgi:pilus assembly protein CpaF
MLSCASVRVREGTERPSPLAAIEARVQARAKDLALDVAAAAGAAQLRALIDEEVAGWRADHRRGLHDVDVADGDGVADRAFRNLAGYGPLEPLLADPDVWEIMVNAPDAIFVRRHVGVSGYHSEVFHDDEHVVRTLTKILDDATGSHRKLDPAEGLQDAQLDDGARLHIVHGDVGRDGHVLVNIRKFTGVAYAELDELVGRDMLDPAAAAFLRAAVRARQSIVFAGAPGAGKTTLLSCCAAELDPSLRVAIAEEVFELDVPLPNVGSMQTRPARADRPEVDLRRLVSGFLRMAPDVAIVGEVRDREGSRRRGNRRCGHPVPARSRGGMSRWKPIKQPVFGSRDKQCAGCGRWFPWAGETGPAGTSSSAPGAPGWISVAIAASCSPAPKRQLSGQLPPWWLKAA